MALEEVGDKKKIRNVKMGKLDLITGGN